MKKSNQARLIISALLVSLFIACTYVVAPQNVIGPTVQSYDTTRRVAVIESWMGHTCIACPMADSILDSLESAYDSSFIAITIHDEFFAEPCPLPHPTPSCGIGFPNAFSNDFRCPTGVAYSAQFPSGPQSPVLGFVNRKDLNTAAEFKYPTSWQQHVDTVVNQNAVASIHASVNYIASTRALNVTFWGTWLQSYSGTINIAVMLTEDSIVGWQTVGSTGCDSQYVFNHVLRECLNTPGAITGTILFSGTTTVGLTYNYSLPTSYTVPSNFNDAHCNVIALIYDVTTGAILQAWEEPIQ